MLFFWKNRQPTNYDELLSAFDSSNLETLRARLAFRDVVEYGSGVDVMLKKMFKPEGDTRNLSLFRTSYNGQFELAIFHVPWSHGELQYLPLIMEQRSGKIFGIMLPFSEIIPLLSRRQQKQINALAIEWTGFAVERRFGWKLSS